MVYYQTNKVIKMQIQKYIHYCKRDLPLHYICLLQSNCFIVQVTEVIYLSTCTRYFSSLWDQTFQLVKKINDSKCVLGQNFVNKWYVTRKFFNSRADVRARLPQQKNTATFLIIIFINLWAYDKTCDQQRQASLRSRTVWSEYLPIASAFYRLQAI